MDTPYPNLQSLKESCGISSFKLVQSKDGNFHLRVTFVSAEAEAKFSGKENISGPVFADAEQYSAIFTREAFDAKVNLSGAPSAYNAVVAELPKPQLAEHCRVAALKGSEPMPQPASFIKLPM